MRFAITQKPEEAIVQGLSFLNAEGAEERHSLCLRGQCAPEAPILLMKAFPEGTLSRFGFRYVADWNELFFIAANLHGNSRAYDSIVFDLTMFADERFLSKIVLLAALLKTHPNLNLVFFVLKEDTEMVRHSLSRLLEWSDAMLVH